MEPKTKKNTLSELPPGWGLPQPQLISEPSIWPAALAMGITLLVWGIVTSLAITGLGLVLFIAAVAGWIKDIRHERSKS